MGGECAGTIYPDGSPAAHYVQETSIIHGGENMLILTITKDDPITIGNTTIHLKDGGQVRLAIDAPREVSVLRRRAKKR